jgi:hypothetical protein
MIVGGGRAEARTTNNRASLRRLSLKMKIELTVDGPVMDIPRALWDARHRIWDDAKRREQEGGAA